MVQKNKQYKNPISFKECYKLFINPSPNGFTKLGDFNLDYCYKEDCRIFLSKIPKNSVDLILTDPPFALSLYKNSDSEISQYNRNSDQIIKGYNEIPLEDYLNFNIEWIKLASESLKKEGSLVIISGWTNQRDILNALYYNGLEIVNQFIFKHNFGVFTTKKLVSSHYNVFICSKKPSKQRFNKLLWYPEDVMEYSEDEDSKDREPLEILNINKEFWKGLERTSNKLPKELVELMVGFYSNINDIVVDCFSGSGTILKVSNYMKRKCIACDLNEELVNFSNYRKSYLNY